MMLHDKIIFVVGGDLRQAHLAKLLAESNQVYTLGLEKAEGLDGRAVTTTLVRERGILPDYIVFPMPVGSSDDTVNTPFSAKKLLIDDVLSLAGPDTFILGGKLSDSFLQKLEARKLPYADYLKREELAVLNAVPTAEGAVQIAMEELATTIFGLNVLVIGYGRISKVLSRMLQSLGANVTVSARKFSDLAWIEAGGYTPAHTLRLDEYLRDSQLIVNTVPAAILNEELLSKVPKSCLLIDLASKPGGVGFSFGPGF